MQSVSGYRALLRLALRRDRIKLPAWVLGLTFLTVYFGNALQVAYPTKKDLSAITGFMDSPAGTIMSGPGYGFDDPTHGVALAGAYGPYLMLGTAFMSILLVARHSRAEEEAGRLELLRAAVVGRKAQLAVTVTLAVAANLVYFLLAWGALSAQYASAPSALLAASIAMVGLMFAGVALVTAQMSEYSRTATGFAAIVIGVAVVVRGAGDTLEKHGSPLSWFSPIAWSQQTRAFYDGRWWPLLLGVLLTGACVTVAGRLQARRDVGAGLLPTRRGSDRAPAWMGSAGGLAARLERSGIIGWGTALLVLGLMYGSLTGSIEDQLAGLDNEVLLKSMGGDPNNLVDGYLGIVGLMDAFVVCCFVLVSAHRLVKEEREGRAEAVLATAVGRRTYLLAALATALIGGIIALLTAGLGTAAGTVASTGDVGYLWPSLSSHLVYFPALAVFVAVAALGFAWRPGWLNVAWVVAVYALIGGMLGRMLDLPDGLLALGVFDHIASVPQEQQELLPWSALLVVAGVLLALASARYRRRDLVTT